MAESRPVELVSLRACALVSSRLIYTLELAHVVGEFTLIDVWKIQRMKLTK